MTAAISDFQVIVSSGFPWPPLLLGAACLSVAFLFRRTLPTWACWALLTVRAALLVGSFLL